MMNNPKFIRCEDNSYVYVPNVTRLSIETDYDDKSRIKAHHNGQSMPFTVASFDTKKDAQIWLLDLVERLEHGDGPVSIPENHKKGIETR